MTRSNAKILHSVATGDGRMIVTVEHEAERGRFGRCQPISDDYPYARFTDGQRVFVNGDRIEGEGMEHVSQPLGRALEDIGRETAK